MDLHKRTRESVTVDEAARRILVQVSALPPRSTPLRVARGLVLAQEIIAGSDSPRFDTSAMDGFAVRAADIRAAASGQQVRLPVVGAIAAGSHSGVVVAPGTAVRVMTGAECPHGADLVIPFEQVTDQSDQIEITMPLPAGANIRLAGEDIAAGRELLGAGTCLWPNHLAIVAGEGIESVDVIPRPRVAVIATGDELVRAGQALEPGQIWDSNSVMLASLVEQFGGEVSACALVRDEPADLLTLLRRQVAYGVDLILTVGGASRGDRDVLAEVATDGIALDFWDILMKPGRPLVFGMIDDIPLIGLPGNPAAAFVSAVQFVRPAILTMLGRMDVRPPVISARVDELITNPGGRRNFVRVTLDADGSDVVARLAGPQNVANLATLSRADGLLVVPEFVAQVEAGTRLDVQVIREL